MNTWSLDAAARAGIGQWLAEYMFYRYNLAPWGWGVYYWMVSMGLCPNIKQSFLLAEGSTETMQLSVFSWLLIVLKSWHCVDLSKIKLAVILHWEKNIYVYFDFFGNRFHISKDPLLPSSTTSDEFSHLMFTELSPFSLSLHLLLLMSQESPLRCKVNYTLRTKGYDRLCREPWWFQTDPNCFFGQIGLYKKCSCNHLHLEPSMAELEPDLVPTENIMIVLYY